MEQQNSEHDESQTSPNKKRRKDAAAQAAAGESAAPAEQSDETVLPAEATEPVAGEPSEAAPLTQEEPDESEAAEPAAVLADGLTVRQVVEAMLFATDSPLPANKIAQLLERGSSRYVRKCIEQLNEEYARQERSFRIEEVAGGYQMLTLPTLQPWLVKLLRARQESRLSPTQMETLAVIAYKQPVLRADVEVVRGVACGDMINRLREMGLVKIVGRAEDVGRPLLYGTTKKFLRVFGLGALEDLPRAEELRAPHAVAAPHLPPATPTPEAEAEATEAAEAQESREPSPQPENP